MTKYTLLKITQGFITLMSIQERTNLQVINQKILQQFQCQMLMHYAVSSLHCNKF